MAAIGLGSRHVQGEQRHAVGETEEHVGRTRRSEQQAIALEPYAPIGQQHCAGAGIGTSLGQPVVPVPLRRRAVERRA
jgi:hypothetical protein